MITASSDTVQTAPPAPAPAPAPVQAQGASITFTAYPVPPPIGTSIDAARTTITIDLVTLRSLIKANPSCLNPLLDYIRAGLVP